MFFKKTLIAAVVAFMAYGFTKPVLKSSDLDAAPIFQDSIIKDSTVLFRTDSLNLDSIVTLDSVSASNTTSLDSSIVEGVGEMVDSSNLIFGTASYYHNMFEGRLTANGQIFRQEKMTCAHRTIPLGKYVTVTNLRNNKTVKLLVNDRMGKSRHEIDLTIAAANKLGFKRAGWTPVRIEILD